MEGGEGLGAVKGQDTFQIGCGFMDMVILIRYTTELRDEDPRYNLFLSEELDCGWLREGGSREIYDSQPARVEVRDAWLISWISSRGCLD